MSEQVPKRRLVRFGLRTLFVVVTVFGCWLGYELDWIRQRREFLSRPHVGFIRGGLDPEDPFADPDDEVYAPWPLRLLGERGVSRIYIDGAEEPKKLQGEAERLFPETDVTAYLK